ncbi:MAG TPA: hypothetical protein VMV45_04040, partial [Casimicrobiaceae bacterium]|nr:hypothetical protein [Casimicrobiaceae bacterium]
IEPMSRIVAAVFDDEPSATAAAYELRRAGFKTDELDQFVLNPPGRHATFPIGGDVDADRQARGGEEGAAKGAAIGAGVGAVAGLAAVPVVGPVAVAGALATGALVGAVASGVKTMGDNADEPSKQQPQERPAGVMVAVNTEFEEDEEVAIDLFRHKGARMVERAEGQWVDGRWVDFNPIEPPKVVEQKAA